MYYLENENTTCDNIGCNKKTSVRLMHKPVNLGSEWTQVALIGKYCKTHGKQELKKYQSPKNTGPQILNPTF